MTEWKPKPKVDAKTEDMNLTGEEGFVLSRIDGFTSVKNLVAVTGLPEGRVRQIVNKLVRQGAVEKGEEPASSSAPVRTEIDAVSARAIAEALGGATMEDDFDGTRTEETRRDDLASAPKPIDLPDDVEAQIDAPSDDAPADATSDAAPADAPGDAGGGDAAADDKAEAEGEPEGEAEGEEEANFRKMFNERLSKLEPPEREALSRSAGDPELMALCFDPLHAVIRGIFENSKAGMAHARMVARHHHTPQGLDVVMARAEFLRDAMVQRALLQNTMLQEPQLKKLLQSKRLMDVYKVSISREIPERNRQKSRNILRNKWSTAEGEERAGLVFTTEGRCLQMLTGLPFDSQMTTYLCAKTYNSVLLIQNLARFGATPPQVLQHLARQPVVKRQAHLRTLIKQHPNCPSDVKRHA